MATMKDIARIAGVSHGTVSNVLNNKGNVSADKIKLVKKAAADLGYSVNAQAQQLRSSLSLTNTVAVILPNITETRFALLYAAIHKYFILMDYKVLLYTTDESPYFEERALKAIVSARASYVFSVSCFINSSNDYDPLIAMGIRILFLERCPPERSAIMGFDYFDAGYQCGLFAAKQGHSHVGVLIGLDYYTNEADFNKGVKAGFKSRCQNGVVSTFSTGPVTSLNTAFEALSPLNKPDAFVCSSDDLCKSLYEAGAVALREAPCIYTLSHSRNNSLQADARYYMSYAALGQQACIYLFEQETDKGKRNITIGAEGFEKRKFPLVRSRAGKTLNLLMPTSSATTALMHMAPFFTKKTNIELNFVVLPLAELTDNLALMPYNDYFDVIRTNVTTTPGFPADALMPLDDKYFRQVTGSMLAKPVQFFSYIGSQPFAVPFDFSMYFQVYHRELFSDAMLSRQFYEIYGRPLKAPETYVEYNQVARFFTRSIMPDSPVEFGTTAIINENTTIVYDFYRRYVSQGGYMRNAAGEFCFDKKIALEVLDLVFEMMKYALISTDGSRKDTPIYNLLEGRTALEMVSAAHTSLLADMKMNRLRGRIDFSMLPMYKNSFGGGALAIPAKSKNKKEALDFIQWACGEDQAYLFARLGGLSPHRKIFLDHEILDMYPWFRVLYDEANGPYVPSDTDYMDRYKFEKLIGNILRNTYHRVISPEDAADLLCENIQSCLLKR